MCRKRNCAGSACSASIVDLDEKPPILWVHGDADAVVSDASFSDINHLGALGIVGWVGAVLPLALTVALTALELLVAFLQAYVFAILTCIYLNDAIHGGH